MKKTKIGTVLKYAILIILCIIVLTGCTIKNDEEKNIKDKTNEEINYLEDEIFTVVNKYIKGEYTENNKINWKDMNKDIQTINNSLDTIMLDLSEVDISNDELINFRNQVNDVSIAINNEDATNFMQKISYLYSLLPNYLEKYSEEKNKVNIMKLKSLVLSSLSYANSLQWEEAKSTVGLAESKYKEMMDDVDYMKEYSYNLNKVYILLGEFKNAVEIEELELCKQKYINFIEKIGD